MQLIKKFIYSKNVWTIGIGMFIVWLGFSAAVATFVDDTEEARTITYQYFLELVLMAFLGASLIVKIAQKIINFRHLFRYFEVDPSWVFVLALGSLFFSLFFRDANFFNFKFISGIFLLGFVPAGLFRISINFVLTLLPSSKNSKISIID